MSFVAYQDAKEIGDRFLDLLSARGITPPTRSATESEMLSLVELLEIWRDPVRAHDMPPHVIRQAAGLHDPAAKVLSSESLPEFNSFEKHLTMIGEAKAFTTITQSTVADGRDDISRKMAELYVGCLAIHCGDQVSLDDPKEAKGDNPDVIFSYDGRTWAIAVKTLVSAKHGQTIYDNIYKAAQQINASSAEIGLIVINAKNVIDHDKLWSPEQQYVNVDQAVEVLTAELRRLADLAAKDRPDTDWNRVFSGKAAPPILFMGQSVACLPIGRAFRAPTPLKAMFAFDAGLEWDPVGEQLATCLNHWMQTLVRENVGPPPS
jgi:hypothetical protein